MLLYNFSARIKTNSESRVHRPGIAESTHRKKISKTHSMYFFLRCGAFNVVTQNKIYSLRSVTLSTPPKKKIMRSEMLSSDENFQLKDSDWLNICCRNYFNGKHSFHISAQLASGGFNAICKKHIHTQLFLARKGIAVKESCAIDINDSFAVFAFWFFYYRWTFQIS